MKTSEIRARFLKFFERNGHTIIESSSLIPQNDPTLLFTNAGMVQFKDVFLGKDNRPYKRATTSQKCVRAGGKHNDLENVGFTARHHTFFEMLGNFSFGDYFKQDAIRFGWEFVTKELGIPPSRLYVSVFEKDDEAADIWHKQEGVPRDRIFRFGEKDNFWSMGETGPCGPCSEIFVDRGEKTGCGKPGCAVGCDCDRFMEIWNLVFMQFDRDTKEQLTPLPKPSVDTGAGLERIASVMQNVNTNYDTDVFQNIISQISSLIPVPLSSAGDTRVSFRVIADHSRAAAFLVGDGVMPSNEGRGYVLRRIMRRAIRHGKKLGFDGPFLHKTASFVIDQMQDAYPDLVDKRAFIERAILAEEEQFFKTLERGLALLDEETARLGSARTLPGEIAFKLYDTYGFPLDLTRVICAEKNISIDETVFEKCMQQQRAESRKHWKGSGQEAVSGRYLKIAADLKAAGKSQLFTGYQSLSETSECLALFQSDETGKPPVIQAVFASTPFYGESGGQTGDRGRIYGQGFEGDVIDTQKPVPDLIVAHIHPRKGVLECGKSYHQEVNKPLRALTERNHTATHLLHWALRKTLGPHVKQSGSMVSPEQLRFDFSHFQAMTAEEIKRVEDLVNDMIWDSREVIKREMPKDEAVASGALAFFGEKYGERVRVVKVGDISTELCGGTHVDKSGDIHLFKISSESAIAAGVRRIIACTSRGAFEHLRAGDAGLRAIKERINAASTEDILAKLDKTAATERELRKQIAGFQSQSASGEADAMLAKATTCAAGRILAGICEPSADGIKHLRDLADLLKKRAPDGIIVLGMKDPAGDKASLLVAIGPKASKSANANEILKRIATHISGRGGGKTDLAQGGGTNPAGLAVAIEEAVKIAGGLQK